MALLGGNKMKHKHCDVIKAWADGAVIQKRLPVIQQWITEDNPSWSENARYRASLAFVEGKPVFKGDVLYEKNSIAPVKFIANKIYCGKLVCKIIHGDDYFFFPRELFWTPPKPKTITVTIPRPESCCNWSNPGLVLYYQDIYEQSIAAKAINKAMK
jgi:hypothetical protein